MSSVDNRIVRMEFQNSDFERNLQTSEESLKKFDSFLKSFGDSGVSSALDKISDKFSTLGIIGVTALQNITNQAIDTGKQLIKSLTTDNISSGWAKLENQTKAVGTLVSQGFDISEVNEQLDKLQWYTDETSYNFNDMLTAVSKFTAQGKGLEESVSALEGIANWAAIAGQNATAGSSAMRELSQAVGVGYVRFQDWSSIQTLMMDYDGLRDMILDTAVAMGTLRKNADDTYTSLLATTTVGQTDFTKAQMASYMTTGKWFTTDVLMSVLNEFSEAVNPVYEYVQEHNVTAAEAIQALEGQISDVALGFFRAAQEARTFGDAMDSVREGVASGWQKTFGILLGDYEQQRELWTDLADRFYEVFVEGGNARNEMLQAWADLGGREKLIQGLWNIFDAGVKIVDTVKRAFRVIFPKKTAQDLLSITEKFEAFTEKLIISDETAEKIGRTLQGVFSIFKLGRDIIYALIKPFASLIGSSNGLADSILTVSAHIGDTIANFVHMIETSDKLKVVSEAVSKVLSGLGIVIGAIGTGIGTAVEKVKDLTKNLSSPLKKIENKFDSATTAVEGFISGLGFLKGKKENIVEIQLASEGLSAAFDDETIKDAPKRLSKISQAFSDLGTNIKSKYDNYIKPVFDTIINFFKTNIFNSGIISGIVKFLSCFVTFKLLYGVVSLIASIPNLIANIINAFSAFVGLWSAWAMSIKANAMLKYALAIGILGTGLYLISKLSPEDFKGLKNTLDFVTDGIKQFIDALSDLSIWSVLAMKWMTGINLLPIVGQFALIIAVGYGIYSILPYLKEIGPAFQEIFNKENFDRFMTYLQGFVGLFDAIMAGSLMYHIQKFVDGLTSVTKTVKSFMGGVFSNNTIQVFKSDTSIAAKILKFAAAIGIVAVSLIALGKFHDDVVKAMDTFYIIVGALEILGLINTMIDGIYTKTGGKDSKTLFASDTASGIIKMAAGIGILAGTLIVLGKVNPETLEKGRDALNSIVLVMVALAGSTKLISASAGQILALAFAVDIVAASTLILAIGLAALSLIPFDDMMNSIAGFAIVLATIGGSMSLILQAANGAKGVILQAGIAIVAVAGATRILTQALVAIQNIDIKNILVDAIALSGTLLAMAFALKMLGKIANPANMGTMAISMIAMAGAILILSIGFSQLAGVDWATIGMAGLVMIGLTAALAILGPAATGGFIGILSIAAAILAIGFAVGAAGWALSMIIDSFTKLAVIIGENGPDIGNGIREICSGIKDGMILVAEGVAESVATIAAWPALAISKVVEGIGSAIEKIKGVLAPSTNSLGEYMIEGIGNGMQSKKSKGILGRAADVALKILFGKWGVNSPSTEGYYVGEMWNEGIAVGMEGNTVVVERAAEGTLNTVIDEFVTGGSDAASAFNTSLAENVDMTPFEGVLSDYMTNLGADRLKESSSIMGVSVGTNVSQAIVDTIENKSSTIDSGLAGVLTSLVGNSQSNWAASEWAKSAAESYTTTYTDKISRAMVVIDQSLAEKQLSTIVATSKFADALSQIRVADSDVSSIAKSANNSLSKSRKSANALLGKFSTYEADDPLHIGGSYTALVNSNRELRTSKGILNDVSNTTTDMLSDSIKWAEDLRRKLREIFSDAKDRDITPSIDYDEMTTNIQNALNSSDYSIDVKANVDTEKALEDWQLSTEELIRKYSELSNIYSHQDDKWHTYWAYNGPRSGYAYEDDEYEYEWVYEGPQSGEYDKELDKYYATVNGELYNISEWTSDLRDAYYGHTDQMVDTITQNTSEITNALRDQTDLESKYNSDVLSSISGLSTKLDGIDTGIDDLSTSLAGMGVYLDGATLVGELTPQIDSNLGNVTKLKSQGVLR